MRKERKGEQGLGQVTKDREPTWVDGDSMRHGAQLKQLDLQRGRSKAQNKSRVYSPLPLL